MIPIRDVTNLERRGQRGDLHGLADPGPAGVQAAESKRSAARSVARDQKGRLLAASSALLLHVSAAQQRLDTGRPDMEVAGFAGSADDFQATLDRVRMTGVDIQGKALAIRSAKDQYDFEGMMQALRRANDDLFSASKDIAALAAQPRRAASVAGLGDLGDLGSLGDFGSEQVQPLKDSAIAALSDLDAAVADASAGYRSAMSALSGNPGGMSRLDSVVGQPLGSITSWAANQRAVVESIPIPGQQISYNETQFTLTEPSRLSYGARGVFVIRDFSAGTYQSPKDSFGGDPVPNVSKSVVVLITQANLAVLQSTASQARRQAAQARSMAGSASQVVSEAQAAAAAAQASQIQQAQQAAAAASASSAQQQRDLAAAQSSQIAQAQQAAQAAAETQRQSNLEAANRASQTAADAAAARADAESRARAEAEQAKLSFQSEQAQRAADLEQARIAAQEASAERQREMQAQIAATQADTAQRQQLLQLFAGSIPSLGPEIAQAALAKALGLDLAPQGGQSGSVVQAEQSTDDQGFAATDTEAGGSIGVFGLAGLGADLYVDELRKQAKIFRSQGAAAVADQLDAEANRIENARTAGPQGVSPSVGARSMLEKGALLVGAFLGVRWLWKRFGRRGRRR